jgi:hypothetical protein
MVVVTRTSEGWEFRPTPAMTQLRFTLLALLAGLCLVGAGVCFWWFGGDEGGVISGVFIILFAVVLLAQGVSGWRLRATPLIVEDSGRVCYGERELCPAKSVQSIQIVPDPQSDADGRQVNLCLSAGTVVKLPRPYFESFLNLEQARAFAEEIARTLNVEIVDPS